MFIDESLPANRGVLEFIYIYIYIYIYIRFKEASFETGMTSKTLDASLKK